ncbi:AAC(3) family N-acetyltransferase [Paenibacillus illinoisensis]|uniref:Aminoglycoside N(3)-acetyltransferase n=1 Tax=Paenibacillus illinoisensis TaxID=59845 RepID=A0A2W0CAT0_9BACL|nr:AAC(3) family N-acetyltransferase [Paenibacillus illinoisensis]PYY29084.1 Aminoglycoside 3-N-acetyltransferase [Paenibacillus illinoisensis]
MHTQQSLFEQLHQLGIDGRSTLLVHSSMKSMGEVEGGADTVLDVFTDYMKDGLLVLPTHTWSTINASNPMFHVESSPCCVGILPELFRKRPGVVRSWHPTHSVAAIGQDAVAFTKDDHLYDTPCARGSAWGKLLDRKATILLVGVDLKRNTFIHGVEEWVDIPGRLTDEHEQLYTVLPDGTEISVPSRRHCGLSWSEHFWKVDEVLQRKGAMRIGRLGGAIVRVCDAAMVEAVITEMLRANPDLFSDNLPLAKE